MSKVNKAMAKQISEIRKQPVLSWSYGHRVSIDFECGGQKALSSQLLGAQLSYLFRPSTLAGHIAFSPEIGMSMSLDSFLGFLSMQIASRFAALLILNEEICAIYVMWCIPTSYKPGHITDLAPLRHMVFCA